MPVVIEIIAYFLQTIVYLLYNFEKIHIGTFQTLDKCCTTPIGDLASAEFLQACNPKNDAKLKGWVNDYMLNKLQLANKANAIDVTEKNTSK